MASKSNTSHKPPVASAKQPGNNIAQKKDRNPDKPGPVKIIKEHLLQYFPGIVCLIIALIIGLLTYKDYGMAWDEPTQRLVGTSSYEYIFHGDQTLKTIEFRDLGAGLELPLVFIEKIFNLNDSREIYQMRHLVTHLFFLFGAFCGYILALRLFKNQFVACLGFILLAFHPRIYAHSYLNTKDIPFVALFIIVFLINQVAFQKNKPSWFLILGFACGYATSIRAMGILFVPCISGFFFIDLLRSGYLKEKTGPILKNYLLFIVGYCSLLYAAWPILWSSPIHYFVEEFKSLSHINWIGGVLLAGKNLQYNMLPWYYVPVWFCITTPELFVVLGLAGVIWVIIEAVMRPMKFILNTPERNFLLYLACFIGPVFIVIALNSVNYDDWRHVYFIYPPFVMLTLFVINKILTNKNKIIVASVCALQICITGIFMIQYHPFQQVYFNNFVSHAPEYLRKNYDMEYWGVGFKQGLDYIVDADKSKRIKIYANYITPLGNNILMLSPEDSNRVQMVPEEMADYFFTNYRDHPNDYLPYKTEYSIKVLNSTILSVFRLEKDPVKLKQIREEGIAGLAKSLAAHPDNMADQAEIAQLYAQVSNYDSAEAHFILAARLDPTNLSAQNNVASLLFTEKKYTQSIEAYKKIIELDPKDDNAYMRIGLAFFNSSQWDSSETYNKLCLKASPKNADAINNLAGAYFFTKKYPQAIEVYKSAIALHPEIADPYENVGVCYLQLHETDSAIFYMKKAIGKNPGYNPAYEALATTYGSTGKIDSARKYEAIAKRGNPAFKL